MILALLQTPTVIPDGPAWLAALAISAPAIAGAVKLGASIGKNGRNGSGGERDVAFQTSTKMTLERLTVVAERQTENMAMVVKTLDAMSQRVEDTHRVVKDVSRRLAKDAT